MIRVSRTARGILAVALASLTAGAAAAYPAQVRADLNVRAGPGTVYSVITVVPGGDVVDVERCVGGWCEIAYAGLSGWVSGNYLAGPAVTAPAPQVYYGGDYYDDDYYDYPAGVTLYMYGGRPFYWRDRRRVFVERRDRRRDWRDMRRERRPDFRETWRERRQDRQEAQRDVRREFRRGDFGRGDATGAIRGRGDREGPIVRRRGD